MSTQLIEVRNLTKVYGSGEVAVHALDGVNLSIPRGEFAAIMGPSGSGKSTLMNILGCLDRPTAGEYILDGRDVSKLGKNELADVRNQKLGFIFQSFNLLPRLTALDNVMLPMLYDLNRNDNVQTQQERAKAALESVGLGQRTHHRPPELSGGQQQRVAIARALVNNPPVILADEPTGNLDSHSSEEVLDILHQLNEQGVTIVMVTHEHDIALHAQRVIWVHDGKIIERVQETTGSKVSDHSLAKEMVQ
ncbi:MAG: ABC transporter ATP-binding protein [Bellilinea sp.]